MANELSNAVALMRSSDFRDWVMAAACYQASVVLTGTGQTTASKALASDALLNPTGPHLNRLVGVLATRTQIASIGTEVGEGAGQVGQTLLLGQIAAVWAPLAAVMYPTA